MAIMMERKRSHSDSSTLTRAAAGAVLCSRIAYGAAMIVAPARVAGGRWLGPGAAGAAATVSLRGTGAREVAVHGLALSALLRGDSVRPWLLASAIGDGADIAATLAAREHLPDGSAKATAVVAGVSAALTVVIAAPLPPCD